MLVRRVLAALLATEQALPYGNISVTSSAGTPLVHFMVVQNEPQLVGISVNQLFSTNYSVGSSGIANADQRAQQVSHAH